MNEFPQNWETEFWHYLSTGDGVKCPIFDTCKLRVEGYACSCTMFGTFPGENKRFCANSCGSGDGEIDLPCADSASGCTGEVKLGKLSKLLSLLAQEWLEQGEVKAPPVPECLIYLMDRECPMEIRYLPMRSYSGAVWKMKDSWVIYLNSNESVERQRLSIFHEAFHILAHCRATPAFKKPGENKGSFNEILADNFALHLLMPEDWIKDRWSNSGSVAGIAREFNVTERAVVARLKTLGLM